MHTLGETRDVKQRRAGCGGACGCNLVEGFKANEKAAKQAAERREWIFWGITIVPFAIGAAWYVLKFAFLSGGDAGKDWSLRMLNMKRGNE